MRSAERIVICGGGVIGCAIGYFLGRQTRHTSGWRDSNARAASC
jgi:glycine/D-amino acid oxidase-like deaminating enzyme